MTDSAICGAAEETRTQLSLAGTSGARFTNLRRYVVVVRYQLHVDLRITPTLFHITQLACDVTPTTSLLRRVGIANCLLIYFDI